MARWAEYAQAVAAIVTILMALVIGPMVRLLWKIKSNDLKHIDEKIDGVALDAKEARKAIEKHIDWHMNQK